MINELFAFLAFLVENCTGVAIVRFYRDNNDDRTSELEEPLIGATPCNLLQDFTEFDQDDHIFQEFDPPEGQESDAKAWKLSLPSWKESVKECLKNVLLIQTVAGSLIGLLIVGIVILDFTFAEWCYNMNSEWNSMPKKVQNLRVTAQAIEGALIEMWDLACIITVFPLTIIKDLHLLTFNLLAGSLDVCYRLYLQMIGMYGASWKSFPLNALFSSTIVINNYLLARKYYPTSMKNTLRLDFILSAQFILGLPAALLLVYGLVPWYMKQDEHTKVVIASISPFLTAIPKLVSRMGAQSLHGIIHPGSACVLSSALYAASAVVFRVMQSDITKFHLFVALGVAHGLIDLIERITVTMRDQIWAYLYRLVRRRRATPKYISLRSRRFVADITIQIMLQEATGLVGSLGYMTVYSILYTHDKPNVDKHMILQFILRACVGLLIDLFFNTISLLIQTRFMNIAVGRVWKKKWRYHVVVNILLLSISVVYFSEYLLKIVQSKYGSMHRAQNCTYPAFL